MLRTDLHSHTTASDGVLSPTGLVDYAAARGVSVLGVTDHDTLGGLEEAIRRGGEVGVEVVPGIEATSWRDGQELHILGYCVDPGSREVAAPFARIRAKRVERMAAMIEKLRALGVTIGEAEAADLARKEGAGAALARPHLARALVASGKVATVQEAFDRYLAEGMPAYVAKTVLASRDAIAAIRAAGGVPVLAHPGRYKYEADFLGLVAEGLLGIEVYYPTHDDVDRARFLELTQKLGLVATGGSDFHGDPNLKRTDLGTVDVPAETVPALREAAARVRGE